VLFTEQGKMKRISSLINMSLKCLTKSYWNSSCT